MQVFEKHSKRSGFTLIEILIVVAIIALLASLILPNLMGRFEASKRKIAKAQIEMLSSAIEAFKLDTGRYPKDLKELLYSDDPNWEGPYLSKNKIPKDPWGREYQYKYPGEHAPYDLYSLGPNGKLDKKAITNWE